MTRLSRRTTKLAFNHRFQRRLQGEDVRPANAYEATISQLVGMIESQWDRARYPQVYESLLAIHAAQARSLGLVAPGASPYELDVLGISFEKGGTSVLADGYLVAGWLTPEQARVHVRLRRLYPADGRPGRHPAGSARRPDDRLFPDRQPLAAGWSDQPLLPLWAGYLQRSERLPIPAVGLCACRADRAAASTRC